MTDASLTAQFQALMAHLQTQQQLPIPLDRKGKQITRRKFSPEEDELLRRIIAQHGASDWNLIAQHVQTRTARQCRDRWRNYVSPEVVNGNWTPEENQLLISKVNEIGPKWATIARSFPRRTDIGLKNHFIAITGKSTTDFMATPYTGTEKSGEAV
jgi:hypothetical protein